MAIIYKTIDIKTNLIYIGSKVKDYDWYFGSGTLITAVIKKRLMEYISLINRNFNEHKLRYWQKTYGRILFKKEILETVDDINNLYEREKFWIEKYKSQDRTIGYNIASPLNNFWIGQKHTVTTKKLMSLRAKDRLKDPKQHPMYGKHPSQITLQKKLKSVYSYDIKNNLQETFYVSRKMASELTGISVGNISGAALGKRQTAGGRIWSNTPLKTDELKQILTMIQNKLPININNSRSKNVYQFNLFGQLINEFNSIKDAFQQTAIYNISRCCRRKQKTAGGYIWSYDPCINICDNYKRNYKDIQKVIEQYSMDKKLIRVYDSIKDASVLLNFSSSAIANCCRGITKSSYGFLWKYQIKNSNI